MQERHDPYISLRNPNFLWNVANLVALTLGTQIQATVVAWQVYALTRDPLSLGLVGLAEALPYISAALYMLFLCVAAFGLCWILFAPSRSFWLSLGLLVITGMVDDVSVIIRSTLLTLRTPQHMLGRVSEVNQIFIGSSNEIGSFESGVAAKLLGTVRSVIFGGLVTLGVVGVTAWKIPPLRKLDQLD